VTTKMKHKWRLESNGEPDLFALDYDVHNGPFCEVCMEGFCVNCTPDWADTECVGDEDE
jgi:hypothetical protein